MSSGCEDVEWFWPQLSPLAHRDASLFQEQQEVRLGFGRSEETSLPKDDSFFSLKFKKNTFYAEVGVIICKSLCCQRYGGK